MQLFFYNFICSFFAYFDIFILLSQYEGMPLAVTEAMILGVPVIVTKYESAIYQVSSECGIVVENKDSTVPVQTFEAVLKIAKDRFKSQYLKDNSDSIKKLNEIFGGENLCRI